VVVLLLAAATAMEVVCMCVCVCMCVRVCVCVGGGGGGYRSALQHLQELFCRAAAQGARRVLDLVFAVVIVRHNYLTADGQQWPEHKPREVNVVRVLRDHNLYQQSKRWGPIGTQGVTVRVRVRACED
jgi:hypothetical protein